MNAATTVVTGLLVLLSTGPPRPAPGQLEAIVIVVNESCETSDISSDRLRKIFMGDDQYLDKNKRVVLLVPEANAPEWALLLKRVYRMSAAQYRQYWIGKLFRAEVSSGPAMADREAMVKLMPKSPGAITFMLASAVSPGLKVLRIDGKLPGDADYKLQ